MNQNSESKAQSPGAGQKLLGQGWNRLAFLLPLGAALAFIAVFLYFFDKLDFGGAFDLAFTDDDVLDLDDAGVKASATRAKMLWGVSALALILGLFLNFFIAIFILKRSLTPFGRKLRFLAMAVVVAVTLVMLILISSGVGGGTSSLLIAKSEEYAQVPIGEFISLTNFLACVVLIIIVAACCSLLFQKRDFEDKVRYLAGQVKHFKLSLSATSSLLVIGIFQLYALYSWPAVFFEDNTSAAIKTLANGLFMSAGILYSILLFVVYLPVAFVQNKAIERLASEAALSGTEIDRTDWLKRNGLSNPPMSVIASYLAMLSPFLISLLTNFLTK